MRLGANLHRLGDKSVTELRKCVIMAGLYADYEVKVRMLENNSTDLERAEIERRTQRLYRHRKAPPQ